MSEIYKKHIETHKQEVFRVIRKIHKSTIHISTITDNDILKILGINQSASVFKYSYNDLIQFWDQHHQQISKVAKLGDQVVGYAIMKQDDEHTQHLMQIVISCEHRRKGIAKRLMVNIINNAIRSGITKIILEVRTTNIPAIELYQKLGFNKNRILSKFYKEVDGIEFVLDLSKRTFDEQKHDRDTGGKFVPKGQTGAPAKGKASKDKANYTANSGKEQKCGNCKFIIRQEGGNKCTKVEGSIASSGWSRFWKSSKKKEDPTKV